MNTFTTLKSKIQRSLMEKTITAIQKMNKEMIFSIINCDFQMNLIKYENFNKTFPIQLIFEMRN